MSPCSLNTNRSPGLDERVVEQAHRRYQQYFDVGRTSVS
jgi:hypothetical protein